MTRNGAGSCASYQSLERKTVRRKSHFAIAVIDTFRSIEWDERQTRLRLMTRSHRNTRLAASVHHYPPPLPGVDHGYSQNANQDLSHYYVGPLPATVFLKVKFIHNRLDFETNFHFFIDLHAVRR